MRHTVNTSNGSKTAYNINRCLLVRKYTEIDLYSTEKHNIWKQNDPKDNL